MRLKGIALLALAACSATDSSESSGSASSHWRTERTTAGDTTVVRTVGAMSPAATLRLVEEATTGKHEQGRVEEMFGRIGNVTPLPNGGIMLLEWNLPREVREFDANGNFVRTLSRRGDGPGEYSEPASLFRSRDGHLFVGEFRLVHVYDSAGKHVRDWSLAIPGKIFPGRLVGASRDGHTFVRLVRTAGEKDTATIYLRMTIEGALVDSIPAPQTKRVQPHFEYHEAVAEGSIGRMRIPFVPYFMSAFSREGYWISGGDAPAYSLLLHRKSGGLLRIESDLPLTPLNPQERESHLYAMTHRMRRADPVASPRISLIPTEKPAYKGLTTDSDGRIWVNLHQPAALEKIDTVPAPIGDKMESRPGMVMRKLPSGAMAIEDARPNNMAQQTERWVEPIVYDVFLPTGEFIGRVPLPRNASLAAASGDKIWLIVTDENDVQRVVRYRVINSKEQLPAGWQ